MSTGKLSFKKIKRKRSSRRLAYSEASRKRDNDTSLEHSYSGIGTRSRLAGVRYYVVCVFRSPVAGLSLRRFAFLFLSLSLLHRPLILSLALTAWPTLFVARARMPAFSVLRVAPGSLSSPVRASNPSWTKVLPAPSRVPRTFLCDRTLHDLLDRRSS